MTFAKDDIIAALRLRYDYYSAQQAFDRARERAGLPDKADLDAKDVRALRTAIAAGGDRTESVLARLDQLLEGAPAAKAGDEPKKDAKKAEPEKSGEKSEKSDAKPAEKTEAKAAEKTEKTDAKPADAKASDKPAEQA